MRTWTQGSKWEYKKRLRARDRDQRAHKKDYSNIKWVREDEVACDDEWAAPSAKRWRRCENITWVGKGRDEENKCGQSIIGQ
jgi:hypothetical protein